MTQAPEASAERSTTDNQDLLNQWAGIAPDAPLARLRAERADVTGAAQRSYQILLEPDDPAGVSRQEREMIALRVALLTPCPPLVAWHRRRLRALGASDGAIAAVEQFPAGPMQPARERAVLDYVDRLTSAPGTATAAHLAELKAAGLAPRDIVTIAQLIALLSFEVRALTGLRLLGEASGGGAIDATGARWPAPAGGGQTSAEARSRFTMDTLRWRPWLPTVDDVGPTPEQAALVQEVAPSPESRPYYALLAHDAPALRERTALFNAVMYGRGGGRRADRELAAVATSLVNGCRYCTSVHARRYVQLTKAEAMMRRLLDEGVATPLDERERALVDYAVMLTADPAGMTIRDLAPLRTSGFSDAEVLDLTYAAAMFAWANRLMQTLGEGELPSAAG